VPERSAGTSPIPHRVHGFVFRRRMRGAPGGRREATMRKAADFVFRFIAGWAGGIAEGAHGWVEGVPHRAKAETRRVSRTSRACDAERPTPRRAVAASSGSRERSGATTPACALRHTRNPPGATGAGCCRRMLLLQLLRLLLLLLKLLLLNVLLKL